MKKLLSIFLLGTICCLSACGVKGPLYFPEKAQAEQNQQK
ncbi:putative lipoprotein [Cricetibacter osteomyelitidis]|uniref:Putative lipoprotein n=1 Tax=Cricetibacter osteomyelitidis TaxID=1521931 RepID=A0A4R2T2J2_9PAST|nr:lipoprotein [Cricetibacter osteomyelitidis]TCP95611.1 putative lipoprotein [Cricetibacter osteomyelitidis]